MDDVGIEIPVLDLEKGIEFYETVFGWSFNREGVPNGASASINGSVGIAMYQTETLRQKGYMWFRVANIDETLKKVTSKKGKVLKAKFHHKGFGDVAMFQDCFGTEIKLSAKPS